MEDLKLNMSEKFAKFVDELEDTTFLDELNLIKTDLNKKADLVLLNSKVDKTDSDIAAILAMNRRGKTESNETCIIKSI